MSPSVSTPTVSQRIETSVADVALSIATKRETAPDSSEIRYYARSFGDPLSRLFWHEQELHLGIMPPHGQKFRKLAESDIFDSLVADRLIFGLSQASVYSEVFDRSYRLDHTPRITYWHEWSPRMLRAAALRLLKLCIKLARLDLTLRNPHPWNLLFDGQQFSYANAGSIMPFDFDTFGRSYEKIARYFVRPLLLVEHGYEHTAQRLLQDIREGTLAKDIDHLNCSWSEWDQKRWHGNALAFLEKVSEHLQTLNPEPTANRWIDYFATDCDFGPGTSWSRKQEALLLMLQDGNIRSVLDLGANIGHYAKLAVDHERQVMAVDFDPGLVDAIYEGTLSSRLPIYSAVMDFTHPTPGDGVDYQWLPPATERYSADLVLCFALAHHMVFGKYRLDFEQIARGVRSFSRSWALVEYVERGKIQPAEWRPDAESWYSVDTFADVLRRHFRFVEVLPPAVDGRRLLVCGPERRHL